MATTLFGSGLTLLLSEAVIRYGDRFLDTSVARMYVYGGGAMVGEGVLLGLVFVVFGLR